MLLSSRNVEKPRNKQIYISRNIRNLKKLNKQRFKKPQEMPTSVKKPQEMSTSVKKRYKHPEMFKPSFVTFLDIS